MLLVFRPYSVGDKVKIGNRVGFVYDISLLATRVDTEDNIRIQVPNSQILNGVVENYTRNPLRRVEVMVTVSPRADARKTKDVIQNCISSFAYLGTAGSTGPAKSVSSPLPPGHTSPGSSTGAEGLEGGSGNGRSASWGSKALSNLIRRRGGWLTPAELVSGLAEQYTQLWRMANGQLRMELADVAVKKAPGPEVVLREITPFGLRWQARVWAPSRRWLLNPLPTTPQKGLLLSYFPVPALGILLTACGHSFHQGTDHF
jgi:small-conductance mechanosensitive channel